MTDQLRELLEDAAGEDFLPPGWQRVVKAIPALLDERDSAQPPEGTKLVLFSEGLMEELAHIQGASLVTWGEPDEHGWYTPTLHTVNSYRAQLDSALTENRELRDYISTLEIIIEATGKPTLSGIPIDAVQAMKAARAALQDSDTREAAP